MPLSWNGIKHRAIAFSKEWRDETREEAEDNGNSRSLPCQNT